MGHWRSICKNVCLKISFYMAEPLWFYKVKGKSCQIWVFCHIYLSRIILLDLFLLKMGCPLDPGKICIPCFTNTCKTVWIWSIQLTLGNEITWLYGRPRLVISQWAFIHWFNTWTQNDNSLRFSRDFLLFSKQKIFSAGQEGDSPIAAGYWDLVE